MVTRTTAATAPHLIMTYCALLALAVLRDDYALLDRAALKRMVGLCQDADGGCVFTSTFFPRPVTSKTVLGSTRFMTTPGADDPDMRMTYCAFVLCALLEDWSCIDLPRALSYIRRCRVRVPSHHSPPFSPSLHLCMIKTTDVRRRIRTNAAGRIAWRTDILRPRGVTPRSGRSRLCASGASTARRVARDRALVTAHASGNTGVCRRWRIRRPYKQTGGCVLWVLVQCRSRRTCTPISLLCVCGGDPHFVD